MEEDTKGNQALEPMLQEEVPFRDHSITAVKLPDGRYAVVLRWVCEVLNLDPQGQVQRIQRTTAIASELFRAKIEPRAGAEKPKRGGGPQIMPVLTLRGFSPWILGINPNEVEEDPKRPGQAEHIRQMILAYQQEAIDVLYTHFMRRAAQLPESRAVIPSEPLAEPQKPESGADAHALTSYYEDLAVWALWQARQHAQEWRGQVQEQLGSLQDQLESEKAVTDLIPEILERLGPETITPAHQGQVRGYVKQLHELTGKPYPTIYDEIRLAFGPARYQDLLEVDWTQIENWFKVQIEGVKRR